MKGLSYKEIGAFDAKTRLSEVLRNVERGDRYTITVRGRAVADLVPTSARNTEGREEAIERLMHPREAGVKGETALRWIREGRK